MSDLRVVDPGFGPWLYIYGEDGIIAEIVGRDEQAKALAQQFIAAPDLLAALEVLRDAFDDLGIDTWPDWIEPHLDAADAAIAKARS